MHPSSLCPYNNLTITFINVSISRPNKCIYIHLSTFAVDFKQSNPQNIQTMKQDAILFSSYTLGNITLKNRVVMAPMTRSRAIGNTPNELMVKYYADRTEAGLIITEGVSPSPNGLGYSRIPGLFNDAQAKGWKAVTDAVHANDGKIFMQMMHTGRVGHPINLPEGAKVMGASPIAHNDQMWTDTQGMQPIPVPEEITDVPALIAEYVHSAKLAVEAGFDGVEIHGANGYLPMQFLSPASNQRTDKYGGSIENRNNFVLELAEAMVAAIGKDKVGIRLSPFNPFNGMTADPQETEQYTLLVEGLKKIGVVYIHFLTFAMQPSFVDDLHKLFGGTFILNGGYTAARAESDLEAGRTELVSFGNHFISNPDLVTRMKQDAELVPADQATFYTPGEVGYNDYKKLN